MSKVLVVDDEVGIRELLSEILYDEGHTVELAENAEQARQARLRARPNLVLLDIWMPDSDGISLLKEWSAQGLLDMPVVMMSGHASIDTAMEATRLGAVDFLEKPITLQKLLKTVSACLAKSAPKALAPAASAMQHTDTIAAPAVPVKSTVLEVPPQSWEEPQTVADDEPWDPYREQLAQLALDQPLREARDEFERIYLEYHLDNARYSMTRVAESTGLERTHLYRKFKQLGIDVRRRWS